MFTDSIKTASDRGMATLAAQIDALNSAADSWFDGTPDSVDTRVAHVKRVLSSATNPALMNDPTPEIVAIAHACETELEKLAEFKSEVVGIDVFDAPRPRTAAVDPRSLSAYGREFVATQVNMFCAENDDAMDDADESDIRATAFVDMHVAGLPVSEAEPIVEAFRAQVAARVRTKQHPREVTARTDFEDSLLFD